MTSKSNWLLQLSLASLSKQLCMMTLALLLNLATHNQRVITMNDVSKIKPSHLQRNAFVYIRQSSPSQVENNRESTARQYALVDRARQLGWAQDQVIAID